MSGNWASILGTPVVDLFPSHFGVSLLKLNIREKGYVALLLRGQHSYQLFGLSYGVALRVQVPNNQILTQNLH